MGHVLIIPALRREADSSASQGSLATNSILLSTFKAGRSVNRWLMPKTSVLGRRDYMIGSPRLSSSGNIASLMSAWENQDTGDPVSTKSKTKEIFLSLSNHLCKQINFWPNSCRSNWFLRPKHSWDTMTMSTHQQIYFKQKSGTQTPFLVFAVTVSL